MLAEGRTDGDRLKGEQIHQASPLPHHLMKCFDCQSLVRSEIEPLGTHHDEPAATSIPISRVRGASQSKPSKLETVSKYHPALA